MIVKTGDIILDDNGRKLEVTSGNDKYVNGTMYDKQINILYIRAKMYQAVPTSIFELVDGVGDFIWYAGRIDKIVASVA